MIVSLLYFVFEYRKNALKSDLAIERLRNEHQKKLLRATLATVEKEREAISKNLHDGFGVLLSTIQLNLQRCVKHHPFLEESVEQLDEAVNEVRLISHQMSPVILSRYGLKRAVEEIFLKQSTVACEMKEWQDEAIKDAFQQLLIYRILQECFFNTLKHSQADHVEVSMVRRDGQLILNYRDNGTGFPDALLEPDADYVSLGHGNILNLAESLGADVTFHNDGGACTTLTIPIDRL
jgi:signal transduction histidine kinase